MSILIRTAFFIGDLIFLNLAIAFSYALLGIEMMGEERSNSVYLFIFSNLTWLFLTVVSNPYSFSRSWSIPKVIRSQVSFIFIHILVVASLIFFFERKYTALQIGVMYGLFIPTFFFWKLFVLYLSTIFFKRNTDIKNVIIVGQRELAKEVRRYFLMHPELKYRFLGLFEKTPQGWPIKEIQKFCEERSINEIYCCLPEMDNSDLRKLIDFGMDSLIRVKLIADYSSFQQKPLELEHYDQIPVFNISTIPLDDIKNQIIKRVFDIVFSSIVIVTVLSWLMPCIAIAIKIDSKGPVFFKQRRSGRDNESFSCLKFRTMVVNQEADTKQATVNDSRVTRLGRFLRISSLDEFPQFFNVLSGDMSTVGPRPHMLKHTKEYSQLISKFMGRHYVKPGITGLAQCMGYRGETRNINDMRNRIKLDRFYIENWSFYFDLKIIFQTIRSVAKGG
ncbi:undecaprenyl-phosphate glucose phosphotransferase [soil metagenome]